MTAGDRSGPEYGPDPEATPAQLRSLEQSLLDAEMRRDRTRVRALLAENFVEFGSSGRIWTRNSIIELLSRETDFVPPAIEDFRCAMLAAKVALVTYRTVRTDPETGEVLTSLRSSIWTWEADCWRMRFHQGTRTPPERSQR
ncbi:DUF4440 domain-containing protein [Acidobacteria bacterium AB60]|nr:DUF4440 domain-containing protein [Acidobacteria bacterium AB60]